MPTCDEQKTYVFDDNKRPPLPYVVGACFEIKRHKPLTPFDNGRCYEFPEVCSLSDPVLPTDVLSPSEIINPRDNLTPWKYSPSDPSQSAPETITERYLRHRPRKTSPHDVDTASRRLQIVRQIRVYDGAYAQVVQCRVSGIQGPLVAKIFDPLYRWEDMDMDFPDSPVGLTETEWSCEAAAYATIRDRGLDGIYTPRFEGCWSFDIPYELELELATSNAADNTNTAHSGPVSEKCGGRQEKDSSEKPERRTFKTNRNVRLLLMEYIPGESILNLLLTGAYRDIPADVRMDLLGRLGEAKSALWHIRVAQCDAHVRNVVVGRNSEHDDVEADVDDVEQAGDAKQDGQHHSSSSCHSIVGDAGPRKRQKFQEQVDQKWRVTLIDFGRSVVHDQPNAKINLRGRLRPALPLPPNPMTRCRGSWPIYPLQMEPNWDGDTPEAPEESNWVDDEYRSFKGRREWMEARWGQGSERAHLYQPIEYDKLHKQRENEE